MKSTVNSDLFINRHLGLSDADEQKMLSRLGFNNIDQFIDQVIPEDIQLKDKSSDCLLYTSPSPRDGIGSRMPSSA